jgi:hypothetical protein
LFALGETIPEYMSVRFATLDDTTGFKPMLDIWTSRAQPWTCFDTDIPQFEESPRNAA